MPDELRWTLMKRQRTIPSEMSFDLDAALDEAVVLSRLNPTPREAALALVHHQLAKSCFCPAGYGGCEELLILSNFCDTYVYADLCADGETSVETVRDFFEDIHNNSEVYEELHFLEARELSVGTIFCEMESEMCAYMQEHHPNDAAAYREAVEPLADIDRWGMEVVLGDEAIGGEIEIRVLCYQAEALAFYRGMYAAAGVGPKAVVVPNLCESHSARSRHLSLDGPLGAVLRAGPLPSALLVPRWNAGLLAGTAWPYLWRGGPRFVWALQAPMPNLGPLIFGQ